MPVHRVPPRPEGFDPRPTGALAMFLVLGVVIGIWLLNGRDPGTGTDPGPASTAQAGSLDPDSGLPYVEVDDLPDEAVTTIRLIDDGGPFRYDQDGATFGNDKGVLPDQPRGYYAEYTVETPGSDDRGARRIVAGDRGELFWTADQDSFARVRR
ncbi:ribonuclease domain-containing protein [Nocardioides plantarum]|uniref:Ribonuclease domain-containing protein n=1 Tax=Nocardioides plantarum TaxID=29299 RepID=A0ABV5KH23_9ACTN|nr:ribonuclease domain-containing protein [Nocardioides plantarum]